MRVLLLWRKSAHVRAILSSTMLDSTNPSCPKNPMLSPLATTAQWREWWVRSKPGVELCVLRRVVLWGLLSLVETQARKGMILPSLKKVIEVVDAEEYAFVVGSSIPVRATTGYESERFNFREALSHAIAADSGGVIDSSDIPLRRFRSLTSLCFSFSFKLFL